MRALLCHCLGHLEVQIHEALFGFVREHLIQEHPALPPTDEQLSEIRATRSYNYLGYAPRHLSGSAFEEEEEFGTDPY
jgi:hypothetical protein